MLIYPWMRKLLVGAEGSEQHDDEKLVMQDALRMIQRHRRQESEDLVAEMKANRAEQTKNWDTTYVITFHDFNRRKTSREKAAALPGGGAKDTQFQYTGDEALDRGAEAQSGMVLASTCGTRSVTSEDYLSAGYPFSSSGYNPFGAKAVRRG